MSKIWQEIEIKTEDDGIVKAIAPVIISASRATDIPAFYSKWFFDRLNKEYILWTNPFNPKIKQYVSFKKTKVIVFWSKFIEPIVPYLKILDEKKINYYFQFTLNDYEKEGFESGLPSLQERIKSFIQLSKLIGREKVIWRFDPLILTKNLSITKLIDKIKNIGQQLLGYTDKLVISFVDINCYKKVQRKLIKDFPEIFNNGNILKSEFTFEQKIEFAEKLASILNQWKRLNPNFSITTCCEDIDLSQFGIDHNSCIDGNLMKNIFKDDKQLIEFLGDDDLKTKLKDKGQRKYCGCIVSKDIGSYNTCKFNCIYCYAKKC